MPERFEQSNAANNDHATTDGPGKIPGPSVVALGEAFGTSEWLRLA